MSRYNYRYNSMKKIRKAVIPAAGFGTRFLPQTKAMPKEMLPIVDKPVIQYVVEELVDAGIRDIVMVTGFLKRAIEDHFDAPNAELINNLKNSGKDEMVADIKRISEMANFIYIRQKGPMGNATPLWNARHIIGDEPFLYFFGDDFIQAEPSRAKQLIAAYDKYQTSILGGIIKESDEDAKRYGYVKGEEVEPGVMKVSDVIEKPGAGNMPSKMAIVSGYLFTPDIFGVLGEMYQKDQQENKREYVYIDALRKLIHEQKKTVHAIEIKNGKYYDTGNKLEYVKTVVEFSIKHKDLNGEFVKFLKELDL